MEIQIVINHGYGVIEKRTISGIKEDGQEFYIIENKAGASYTRERMKKEEIISIQFI